MVRRPRYPCTDVLSWGLGADLRHCGARDSCVLLEATGSSSRLLSSCEQQLVLVQQQPDTTGEAGQGLGCEAEDEVQSLWTAGTLATRLDLPEEKRRIQRQRQGQGQGSEQGEERWQIIAELYEIDIGITKQAQGCLLLRERQPPGRTLCRDGSSLWAFRSREPRIGWCRSEKTWGRGATADDLATREVGAGVPTGATLHATTEQGSSTTTCRKSGSWSDDADASPQVAWLLRASGERIDWGDYGILSWRGAGSRDT